MSPKNFLFVSYDALITDIAWRVARQGHAVKYYIDNPNLQEVGDGFLPKTDNWQKEVDWADVIVFDDVLGHGPWAHELRQRGKHVVGGTPYTDRLEDDRSFGQEELRKHKVTIIPYRDFTSFDKAIAYVRENPARYVIKPSGEAQNIKSLLFVGEEEDGQDVVRVLGDYQRAWADQIPVFQLQRRVTGVEVAVGAFFNGKKFIEPININFEHKKLFPGNLGPSTGEMGTTFFWSGPNKLFNATLKKFETKLAQEGYVGYIDINCIVNGNGIYPLEWTSRFGYPLISIQEDSMVTPIGEFFLPHCDGTRRKTEGKKWFPYRRTPGGAAFPLQRQEELRGHVEGCRGGFQKSHRRSPPRRSQASTRRVDGDRCSGRSTYYLRQRPHDGSGPKAGLRAHQEHSDSPHVLSYRHWRPLA